MATATAQPVSRRPRVVVMSTGPVTVRRAGPAIRSWGIAAALSGECRVTLLTPNQDHPAGDGFEIRCHRNDQRLMREVADAHDVLVVQGYTLDSFPELTATTARLVIDLYDPFTLEALHVNAQRGMRERVIANRAALNILTRQLAVGDFFICGHERQRDYWLGMLSALNRLNPQNSDDDASFRRLIGVVPFGLPPGTATHSRQVLKGVHPGIGKDDKVVLWVGGIWDWFDPLTPIRAIHALSRTRHDIKLVFLGVSSPDPAVPRMRMHREALALSKQLGVHDSSVFFLEWVPYADMANYLLEADLGTYMHQDHLETRYSIRTRIFDYIWAGLPMVLSAGDVMGTLAEGAGVATTVPVGDIAGFAATVASLCNEADLRASRAICFAGLRENMSWASAVRPLLEFCRHPALAADRASPYQQAIVTADAVGDMAPAWRLPSKALAHLREHGPRGLGAEVRRTLRRRGLLR